jgi:Ca2+-binding EF-hand superfamily protein
LKYSSFEIPKEKRAGGMGNTKSRARHVHAVGNIASQQRGAVKKVYFTTDVAEHIIWKERSFLQMHHISRIVDKYRDLSPDHSLNSKISRQVLVYFLCKTCTISKDIEVINKLIDRVTKSRNLMAFGIKEFAQISVLYYRMTSSESKKLQFQIFDSDMDGKLSKLDLRAALMYASTPKLKAILEQFISNSYNQQGITLNSFLTACHTFSISKIDSIATGVLLHTGYAELEAIDMNSEEKQPEESWSAGVFALAEAFGRNLEVNNEAVAVPAEENNMHIGHVPIASTVSEINEAQRVGENSDQNNIIISAESLTEEQVRQYIGTQHSS